MSSCKKDELISYNKVTQIRSLETKKEEKTNLKKRKLRLFKRKKCRTI